MSFPVLQGMKRERRIASVDWLLMKAMIRALSDLFHTQLPNPSNSGGNRGLSASRMKRIIAFNRELKRENGPLCFDQSTLTTKSRFGKLTEDESN